VNAKGLIEFVPDHSAYHATFPSQGDFTGELYSFFRVIGFASEIHPSDEDIFLAHMQNGQFLVKFIDEPFTVLSPMVGFS
jgi:hypothetical protein